MSDGQPRAEWIFPEEKKSNKGRIWLIVGLSVLALAIVGTLLFFLLPRDGEPTPSPSPSASSSATTSPSPTSAPTPTSTPTSEPVPTQPPPAPDPDVDAFVAQVQPRLDDAVRGLQLVRDNMDLGAQIVDSLQNDAAVLSDTPAPSSLAADWSDAVSQYASKLADLRAAYDNGSDPQAPLEAASTALQKVRAVAGL
ncbi:MULTISPECIES: hypothetical protein [unclassified Microbacterium]|uniref:hypothetical protein n=1 Tax=unclassified Microbacterium TaxID=2609290 RepID=UPI002B9E20E9|nr:hypothetical protein [Microbacterium sp.]HWK77251.1 hypothetical protein [Microbacterium sp.]